MNLFRVPRSTRFRSQSFPDSDSFAAIPPAREARKSRVRCSPAKVQLLQKARSSSVIRRSPPDGGTECARKAGFHPSGRSYITQVVSGGPSPTHWRDFQHIDNKAGELCPEFGHSHAGSPGSASSAMTPTPAGCFPAGEFGAWIWSTLDWRKQCGCPLRLSRFLASFRFCCW